MTGLFALRVLEPSEHGHLAHCFWACGEAAHYGGSMWQMNGTQKPKRETGKLWGPDTLFNTWVFNTLTFGDIQDPN